MPDLAAIFLLVLLFVLVYYMLIPELPVQEPGKRLLRVTVAVIALIVLLGWVGGFITWPAHGRL